MNFEVIGILEEGNVPQLQGACYVGSDQIAVPCEARDGAVPQEAHECGDARDESLRIISCAIFSKLHMLLKNGQLYTLKEEEQVRWAEVTKCQLETERLPLVFLVVPLGVMEVLGMTHLQALTN